MGLCKPFTQQLMGSYKQGLCKMLHNLHKMVPGRNNK